jgi:hypothetical protein
LGSSLDWWWCLGALISNNEVKTPSSQTLTQSLNFDSHTNRQSWLCSLIIKFSKLWTVTKHPFDSWDRCTVSQGFNETQNCDRHVH